MKQMDETAEALAVADAPVPAPGVEEQTPLAPGDHGDCQPRFADAWTQTTPAELQSTSMGHQATLDLPTATTSTG